MHKGLVVGAVVAALGIIAVGWTAVKYNAKGESEMTMDAAQHKNVLRDADIALIASATATGDMETLTTALNTALDNGMTVNQGKEILVQLYAYCGFPRALNAISNYMDVIADREARGIFDTVGDAPTPLVGDSETKNKIGSDTREVLAGGPVSAANLTFAPAIDDFLKEHLFADIFARGLLTEQQREIATIAALAAMSGTESQLNSHIAFGKNVGLTDEQVRDTLDIATKPRNLMFGFGGTNPSGQYFTGPSYLEHISDSQVTMFNVTFEPTVRNNWHIHHGAGQILLATNGRGWYQEWGKDPIELHPGDVVNIPAEVKHWHGAAHDSWFTHIAVEVPGTTSNEWLEPVTDEEYNKLK